MTGRRRQITDKNYRNPEYIDKPPPDLPMKARVAMLDYMYELRRQNRGVRKVTKPNAKKPYVEDPFTVPSAKQDTGIQSTVTKLRRGKGEAPAMAYVRSLGMNALVASEVARELGVSTNLIRKWIADKSIKAPSFEVPYGKNKIYLFTTDDVQELRELIARQRTPLPRQRNR